MAAGSFSPAETKQNLLLHDNILDDGQARDIWLRSKGSQEMALS